MVGHTVVVSIRPPVTDDLGYRVSGTKTHSGRSPELDNRVLCRSTVWSTGLGGDGYYRSTGCRRSRRSGHLDEDISEWISRTEGEQGLLWTYHGG